MNGQRIGYIRVSTLDQHTERQLDGIELDKTFTDKASGKDTKRPQLELMMSFVRSGDTLIVHSMDRLARDQNDLHRIVGHPRKAGHPCATMVSSSEVLTVHTGHFACRSHIASVPR